MSEREKVITVCPNHNDALVYEVVVIQIELIYRFFYAYFQIRGQAVARLC
ncbi:MAG: hypothetical protein ACREAB_10010 [Blastocatellia bacterium]